jgi:hypothetical protein
MAPGSYLQAATVTAADTRYVCADSEKQMFVHE